MYALAFDLGTTTLVGYLCDLSEGKIKGTIEKQNPQIEYGLDVLSRVTFASDSSENRTRLKEMMRKTIEDIADEFLGRFCENEADKSLINEGYSHILMVGNPVIMSFVRDISFTKAYLVNTRIITLPNIGGFVGSDALAASFVVNEDRKGEKVFVIDIGTNTEIVLLTDERIMTASAASGPALEGGNITCGMRGENGAIDKFSLTKSVNSDSDIVFHVIDNGSGKGSDDNDLRWPKGICGSGLLSLIRVLLDSGVLNNDGYLYSKTEALEQKVPYRIASRVVDGINCDLMGNATSDRECNTAKKGRYFRITDDVFISQEDIRNVQLAVAAIRSGVEIILMKSGLTKRVIDRIYLAGNFGNSIDIGSILDLGLLPDMGSEKIVKAGNLAGLGACLLAFNEAKITDAIKFRDSAESISLAKEDCFQDVFMHFMNFDRRD